MFLNRKNGMSISTSYGYLLQSMFTFLDRVVGVDILSIRLGWKSDYVCFSFDGGLVL